MKTCASKRPPKEGTLADRVNKFFLENRGEYLTYDDVAAKFGCSRQYAVEQIRDLKDSGHLASEEFIFRPASIRREEVV